MDDDGDLVLYEDAMQEILELRKAKEKAEAEELKLRAFITTMLHHAEQDERLGVYNVKFSNELYNDLKIKFSMKKDGEG
jgi:hypothetical protein